MIPLRKLILNVALNEEDKTRLEDASADEPLYPGWVVTNNTAGCVPAGHPYIGRS